MEVCIQIRDIKPSDLKILSGVFGILQGTGLEVKVTELGTKSGPVVTAKPAEAKKPRGPKLAESTEIGGTADEDTFSRYTRNNPAMFTGAVRKRLDPILDEALGAYHGAAGAKAQGGRTIKNWSISRLREETAKFKR